MTSALDENTLEDDEKRLLTALRARENSRRKRAESDAAADPATWLVRSWRELVADPAATPLWATGLRYRLAEVTTSSGETASGGAGGLFDSDGFVARSPGRLLGTLYGGALGESVARHDSRGTERTAALLCALDELIHAHAELRELGRAEPLRAVLTGQQRWLRSRGVPVDPAVERHGSATLVGTTLDDPRLVGSGGGDPVMLTVLARLASDGAPASPEHPGNDVESAGAVPLGALAALWAEDDRSAFRLGSEIAAITHGGARGHLPAGVLAVLVSRLLRGHGLAAAAELAIGSCPHPDIAAELSEAVRLAGFRPAGSLPSAGNLAATADGGTGSGALAIALRVALSASEDCIAAIDVAAGHEGDTATSAMLCGQLLGALHGPERVNRTGETSPWIAPLLERVTAAAVAEFGPAPTDTAPRGESLPARSSRRPELTEHVSTDETIDESSAEAAWRPRFVRAVLGCAVGEALGGAVTSDSWREIRDRYGEEGLREYVPAGHPSGRIGSDTQLLLFTLEGTIRAGVSRRTLGGVGRPTRHVQHAYQRWLHTQHLSWPRAAGEFRSTAAEPDGWLVELRGLFQTRSPGRTMMRTLIAFAKGQQTMGSPEEPVSDSDGSSALLRAIPAMLWTPRADETFRVATETAALTHGHPTAWLSAGTLGVVVSRLSRDEGLSEAVDAAVTELGRHPEHEAVTRRIDAARKLAESGVVEPERLERTLGTGFNAAEALAIGLYAALVAEGDFAAGLRTAVNHSGNSGVCGAVTGTLLAMSADEEIPEHWTQQLELGETVRALAADGCLEFGPNPPETPEWFERYPGS
ncbi:ADP-ribosylglycohydrolase [Actinopolyspora mzabensis]|uniref:ADP-ribosylglycohydrolase n=1 Tax=Actinopolyspora mzabensis TaxID=995066 RepID=A0A1G9E3V5_ACTMZ|nr:ADP-ribosylglycohydrolase family protein [Actinopolyspora mzabensis]SDK70825.1 ADP-ribosylglycohydrolase [Actinopolyspora mzabensis]